MKAGLLVVVALVLSAFTAHFLLQDPGYVVINFRGYVIEMSVPVLLALFVLALAGVWLVIKIFRAPRRLGQAAGRYRANRAGERLTRGMIQIAEGNLAKGERMLARAANASDAPLLNYLQAARAAHLLGEDERRDGWLRQAYERMPEASNAVLLTQAEFQLDQGQFEQALATLRRIEEDAPNHSQALTLLGRLYFRLEDWRHLGDLLPRLRKHGRVDEATLEEWQQAVYRAALERAADADAVDDAWRDVPKKLRSRPELREAYFRALIRIGEHDRADREIAQALKHDWSGPLARLYGLVDTGNPGRQLKRAEGWLAEHGDDPDLLLTAARLCVRNELWGKARSYLESALSVRPSGETYLEYGRLLTRLGERDAAADAFRAGLGLESEAGLPAIPHLSPDGPDDGADGGNDR